MKKERGRKLRELASDNAVAVYDAVEPWNISLVMNGLFLMPKA
jgi:hypothetical protein